MSVLNAKKVIVVATEYETLMNAKFGGCNQLNGRVRTPGAVVEPVMRHGWVQKSVVVVATEYETWLMQNLVVATN